MSYSYEVSSVLRAPVLWHQAATSQCLLAEGNSKPITEFGTNHWSRGAARIELIVELLPDAESWDRLGGPGMAKPESVLPDIPSLMKDTDK